MSEVQGRKLYFNDKLTLPGDVFLILHMLLRYSEKLKGHG
jgi:hypothetical protein